MQLLRSNEIDLLCNTVVEYRNWLVNNVKIPVRGLLRITPPELENAIVELSQLEDLLKDKPSGEINPTLLPILKRAIIHIRRLKASDIEKRSGFTSKHDLRTIITEELNTFSAIMSQDWFKSVEMRGSLKITDFLSIQHAEGILRGQTKMQLNERTYDEKFHILNAPDLFLPDLVYYRITCELRSVPLCVAYLDIDDFKDFNTRYGEPRVDRDVLPGFMSALESQVYSHGYAYRFGGDEYISILPNMSASKAIIFFKSFQNVLRGLDYFQIKERTEVSIGIVEVSEESSQTDLEIKQAAAHAKDVAKRSGKNCIATYKGQSLADEDIYVIKGDDSNLS